MNTVFLSSLIQFSEKKTGEKEGKKEATEAENEETKVGGRKGKTKDWIMKKLMEKNI